MSNIIERLVTVSFQTEVDFGEGGMHLVQVDDDEITVSIDLDYVNDDDLLESVSFSELIKNVADNFEEYLPALIEEGIDDDAILQFLIHIDTHHRDTLAGFINRYNKIEEASKRRETEADEDYEYPRVDYSKITRDMV